MKHFIIYLLLPLSLYSQKRDSVHFSTTHYKGIYSEIKEQPLLIEYEVNNCNYGINRKGLEFYTCDSIHTSDHRDYYKNVWDKGHMVPAASQNCSRGMIKETFSYLNCALQHQDLNRNVWRYLEEYERKLSKVQDVHIKITVEFKHKQKLKSGATIPSGFHKSIIINGGDLIMEYYFPNKPPVSKQFDYYQIK